MSPLFILQPTIAIGAAATAPPAASTDTPGVPRSGSTFVPIARLGVELRPVALLLSVSYATEGTSGKAVDTVAHVHALAEPILWRSADEHTRVYGLVGIGVVTVEAPVVGATGAFTTASDGGPSFQAGLGGQRAVGDDLRLGAEVFVQLDVVGNGPYVASATYVALTGTFATGD